MGQRLSTHLKRKMLEPKKSRSNGPTAPGRLPNENGNSSTHGVIRKTHCHHVEQCIVDLQTKYLFYGRDGDPKCPWGKAMLTFQEFTMGLIADLRAGKDYASIYAHSNMLERLYEKLPDFKNIPVFHSWVQDAMMKHPERRTGDQVMFMAIIEYVGSVEEKLEHMSNCVATHFRDAYDVENLLKDPDQLYIFSTGRKAVQEGDQNCPKPGDTCAICTENFAPSSTWELEVANSPQLCPCGHIFCGGCLELWREQVRHGVFTCPMCRKCLVCGESNCRHHKINNIEKVQPLPLATVLALVKQGEGTLLYGYKPAQYWVLREQTRGLRTRLARIEHYLPTLDTDRSEQVYQYYADEYDATWQRLRQYAAAMDTEE